MSENTLSTFVDGIVTNLDKDFVDGIVTNLDKDLAEHEGVRNIRKDVSAP